MVKLLFSVPKKETILSKVNPKLRFHYTVLCFRLNLTITKCQMNCHVLSNSNLKVNRYSIHHVSLPDRRNKYGLIREKLTLHADFRPQKNLFFLEISILLLSPGFRLNLLKCGSVLRNGCQDRQANQLRIGV